MKGEAGMGAVKPNIKKISIKAIKVDHDLQSRVRTDKEVVQDYANAVLVYAEDKFKNGNFPPVVLFDDGKTYWLADGFHRLAAHIKAELPTILSEVREGTRRDAILFSAGANAKMGLRPSAADKEKAILMILKDELWRQKGVSEISRLVGTSSHVVNRVRSKFFSENNIEIPEETEFFNARVGKAIKRRAARRGVTRLSEHVVRGRYTAKIGSKYVDFGTDKDKAKVDLDMLLKAKWSSRHRFSNATNFARTLTSVPIVCRTLGTEFLNHQYGVVISSTFVVTFIQEVTPGNFHQAVGRILMARQRFAPGLVPIVACFLDGNSVVLSDLIEDARALGVRVMTPWDLIDECGPKDDVEENGEECPTA
jgi:hypothetical protein